MAETSTQRIERIKREKPSWSILDDIRHYAVAGFDSIPEDDLSVRLRAWGLYTQGDGQGVRGEATRHFMMRVRTPNGLVSSAMARTIADLSDRYARGSLDITNRQNFQLHWLRIEDVPAVWDALAAVGWTSMGACGDNTRTVTGCPLAGVDAAEIADASPVALAVDRRMNGNPLYANLPRKFKISITGCAHWCTYPEINDIGLTAVSDRGFSLRVGGGLSTRPRLADRLDAFVPWTAAPDVVDAVASIFRDSEELRVQRAKARMKFLFLTHGWTPERFLREIESRLGYALDPATPETPPDGSFRDHVGVHPDKSGTFYAGFTVASGRITPGALRALASLSEDYGIGALRTTAMQNVVVLGIPAERVGAFQRASMRSAAPPLEGSAFRRGMLSCTGSEYCKLAVVETKRFSLDLIPELERRLPGFSSQVKIYVTGCPNACGQHWIADIGLQGVRLDDADGFDIFLGGGLGANPGFAQRAGVRVAATEAADVLEALFREYLGSRLTDESFRAWTARVGPDHVKSALEIDTVPCGRGRPGRTGRPPGSRL